MAPRQKLEEASVTSRKNLRPMTHFDFATRFVLAHQSLILVARGISERDAVAQILPPDPRQSNLRRETLALVLSITNEQDKLDMSVQNALRNKNLGISATCIFRLVAYLITRSTDAPNITSIERRVRAVVPSGLHQQMEWLLGNLVRSGSGGKLGDLSNSQRVAESCNQPVWWVDYCFRVFGRSEAVALLAQRRRARYVRVNPLKNKGQTRLPKGARDSAAITQMPGEANLYILNGSPSELSRFFSIGLFQIQDFASFLAVKAAGPVPGEKVLELCAAPGAKTAAAAQLMENRGQIVALDYSLRRMNAWKREIERLGVTIAEPCIEDGTRLGLKGSFDLVLVDPPCSGTGILDRNPTMKWHLSAQSVDRYSSLQKRLLESASTQLKESGRILYCTCSLTLEENEKVVSSFLKSHPEFETRPILKDHGSPGLLGLVDCRRFYPHRDRTAGYFISRMEKFG